MSLLPQGIVTRAVYLTAIDSVNQTFALADTAQVIDFDTLIENQNITNLGNGEFEIKDAGGYLIVASIQITKTINGNIVYCAWLQKDTGSGFVNVDFSIVQNLLTGTGLGSTSSKSVVVIWELELNADDKIRLMNSTDDTDLELMADASPAVGPDIPSAKITITKTGRL